MRRSVAAFTVSAVAATLAVVGLTPAEAFKPYTHLQTSNPALADVTDDGHVTIDGREYPVRQEVVDALKAYPAHYNAGVIGPDGFPDLTFGQSTIHPEQTGKWLEYLLRKAWQAQTDPRYDGQRGQILAFAYGYLTHAAGDMWAHTFVNDFADGVFPGVGELLDEATQGKAEKAAIAIRHTIVEGYIGDATTGYDGNPNRTTVGSDVSDDSTPGIGFDAPRGWIYDVLVDPHQPLPVGTCGNGQDDDGDTVVDDGCPGGNPMNGDAEAVRGPLIDYFLDLQADLQAKAAALQEDQDFEDCLHADKDCYEKTRTITVPTVRGPRQASYTRWECIGAATGLCVIDPVDLADDLSATLLSLEYIEAWIEDIEDGLKEWGTVGLASTRALFDPQTRRDLQNEECHHLGSETTQARINCEDGIGTTDVLMDQLDPYITDHMLSMMGAPDAVGGAIEVLGAIGDFLDDLLGPALNPLRVAKAAIREEIKQIVLKQVKDQFGIDVETIGAIMRNPTYYMDARTMKLPIGGQEVTVSLFSEDDHQRLDEWLHLPADHHVDSTATLPDGTVVESSALRDDVVFSDLAPFDNASVTAKLLLLDGPQLNAVLGNTLADAGVLKSASTVTTYADQGGRPANVMVDGLGSSPWLSTIDGDHTWRQDGLPRWEPGDAHHGGSGTFPLWESCLLRPAFRLFYDDWENDADPVETDFPDLGDGTSADPSDTAHPETAVAISGGPSFVKDGTSYYGGGNQLSVTGSDTVFADNGVEVESRRYPKGSVPTDFAPVTGPVALDGADGRWLIDARAGDPCHSVESATPATTEVVLDTTGPVISWGGPADEATFDTDDSPRLTWSTSDGSDGSGVKEQAATLDGNPIANGATIDMFFQTAGVHTLRITAQDELGNQTVSTRTFRVRATSASLLSNLDRARGLGWVPGTGAYQGMRTSLQAAITAHNQGKHPTEVNKLGAVLNQLRDGMAKNLVDRTWGTRFEGYLVDIIAVHR